MRVLVTGHKGYLGAVLTSVLRHAHHEVAGLDCDLYGDCDFGRVRDPIDGFDCDIRGIEAADLAQFDAVIHLAALPDDPAGLLTPTLIQEVNAGATFRLAHRCREAGVARLIFASTCAVYGSRGGEWLREEAAPRPVTAYAKSKLLAEAAVSQLASDAFAPVHLRLGTLYGMSPRMRVDTVVNDFVGAAVTSGRVGMKTQGWAWRPFVHVQDVARAILETLKAPRELVCNEVFNVVNSHSNCRVIDVADRVAELVPNCARLASTGVTDLLSYRVSGDKFAGAFPNFRWRYDLSEGIRQLRCGYDNAGLTHGEWRSDRYRRAMRLAAMVERGQIDLTLPAMHTTAA